MLTQPNINTSQTHHPFPAQIQAHFIPSGTRLEQLYQDSLFFLHDTNIIARQGMGQSTRTPTLSQVRAVSTQREPTGRVIIVIVTEREERREEKRGEERREKSTTEERREERRETRRDRDEKRQTERQTEGQTEHERREGGKRLRV